MADSLDHWKQYRRHPIEIAHGTVIMLTLFDGATNWDDLWLSDVEPADRMDRYDEAAEQFIKQIEGNDCIAFHQALIRACQKRVDEWAARCAATASGEQK